MMVVVMMVQRGRTMIIMTARRAIHHYHSRGATMIIMPRAIIHDISSRATGQNDGSNAQHQCR
jgi:hypothetical protein